MIMAFWSKKRITDSITKYLTEQNVTYKLENGYLSFELYFKNAGYSLFPYVKVDEDLEEVSIMINIKELTEDAKILDYSKINSFNTSSKYFTAKIKERVIFLEYNCNTSYDGITKILGNAIESLFGLQDSMDNF